MPHIHNKDGTLQFATDYYCFSNKDTYPQGTVLLKREYVVMVTGLGGFYIGERKGSARQHMFLNQRGLGHSGH
jgi:hypothetical protein